MPEGESIHRAAAALRTALVDKKMVRFDAPRLIGITPQAGRTVESVESHGRHLEIRWDDGVILHTYLRMSGSWHLYRSDESWQLSHQQLRVLIEVDGWIAVCFNAPVVETYRTPDASRHPGLGGLGPDLGRADADLGRCVELLLAYDEPQAPVAEVLLDQRVFCGVGNVYRCEVLWAGELSPFAPVADLPEADAVRLVNVAATALRANLHHRERIAVPGAPSGLAVYGRNGQRCLRCAGTIEARTADEHAPVLYWCPACQTRLDPRRRDDTPAMDPHPAARKFLDDLPWRRTG